MKIGDIVNIRKFSGEYWKGKITDIAKNDLMGWVYRQPIVTVTEMNTPFFAVFVEKDLTYENGEYYHDPKYTSDPEKLSQEEYDEFLELYRQTDPTYDNGKKHACIKKILETCTVEG